MRLPEEGRREFGWENFVRFLACEPQIHLCRVCAALEDLRFCETKCGGSGGAGGGLDEEAVLEKGLERVEKSGALFLKLLTEAVFDAAQGELQVRKDQFVWLAADDGDQGHETTLARDGVTLIRQGKRGSEVSFFIFQLECDALDGAVDAVGGGVSCGVATCKGDECQRVGVDQENFFDLEAVGFFKQDVLIGATGEECLKVPQKAVPRAGGLEGAGGRCVFGEGAADRCPEHWLKISIHSIFAREDGPPHGSFDDGGEGVGEVIIREICGG